MAYSIAVGKRKLLRQYICSRNFMAVFSLYEDFPWVIEGLDVPGIVSLAYSMEDIGMRDESQVFRRIACAKASDSEIEILTRHWIEK